MAHSIKGRPGCLNQPMSVRIWFTRYGIGDLLNLIDVSDKFCRRTDGAVCDVSGRKETDHTVAAEPILLLTKSTTPRE
jgi:hypothetical protein